MGYKSINLQAGVEMRVDIAGALLLVDSVSTGPGVDIATVKNGTATAYIPGRLAGFRMVGEFEGVLFKSPLDCVVGVFLSFQDVQLGGTAGGAVAIPAGVSVTNDVAHSLPVILTGSSNTTPIPVSMASIRVNNAVGDPVPVLFAGTVSPVLGITTIDNTDAEAIPIVQKAGVVFEVLNKNTDAQAVPVRNQALFAITNLPVVVAGLAAVLLSSDADLRRLVVRNGSATALVAVGGAGVTLANAVIQLAPGDVWVEDNAPGAAWYAISDTAATNVQLQGLK